MKQGKNKSKANFSVKAKLLVAFLSLVVVAGLALVQFENAQTAKATTIERNNPIPLSGGYTESTNISFEYPSSTTSGLSYQIPPNAVVVEIGYGSDDHDYYVSATQGHFVQTSPGIWGVASSNNLQSLYGNERRGNLVTLNYPPAPNSYISQWGWSSSHTSGGQGDVNDSPDNVCVHVKYRLFDPDTHALLPTEGESGNCRQNGYTIPGGLRGFIRATEGNFLTGIIQFQIGNDAKTRGGRMVKRTINLASLGAHYQSDSLPDSASPNQQQEAAVNMINEGILPWISDRVIPDPNSADCSSFYNYNPELGLPPDDPTETCHETKIGSSTNYVLKRIDGESSVQTQGEEFSFKHIISIDHRWVSNRYCDEYEGENGPNVMRNDRSIFAKITTFLKNLFIKNAYAESVRCIDWVDVWQDNAVTSAQNINTNAVANFPTVHYTGTVAGTYNLRFQMIDKSRNLQFGDVVVVPVTINGPAFTFSCDQIHQTTTGSPSDFAVWATPGAGFSSNITVTATVTESPGPVPSPTSVTLVPTGYIGSMHFTTTGLQPGTYHINFNATGGSYTAPSCPATLEVIPLSARILNFKYNDQTSPPTINVPYNTAQQVIKLQTENATNGCEATSTPSTSWNGHKAEAQAVRSENVTPAPLASGLYTFTVTCSNATSSDTKTLEVNVGNAPLPTPTADITCRQGLSFIDGPCEVTSGQYGSIKWNSQNADYCDISGFPAPNTTIHVGPRFNTQGGYSVGNLSRPPNTRRFTIVCGRASDGQVSVPDNTDFNIAALPVPTGALQCETVSTCTVASGEAATLDYSVTNATSCEVEGISPRYIFYPPSLSTYNGNVSTGNLTGPATRTYTLTCTGPGGSSDPSDVIVSVEQPERPTLNLQCRGSDGQLQPNLCSVLPGTPGRLEWTSTNANGCHLWSEGWEEDLDPEGQTNTPMITEDTEFNATCSGPGGTSPADRVTFEIEATSPVTVDLKCQPDANRAIGYTNGPCAVNSGAAGSLSWTSTGGARSCHIASSSASAPGGSGSGTVLGAKTAAKNNNNVDTGSGSGGGIERSEGWSVDVDASGTIQTPTMTSATNFTITCTKPNFTSAPDSVAFQITNSTVSANLECKGATGSYGNGPCTVQSGNAGSLKWSSVNATSCVIGDPGQPPSEDTLPTSGTQSTGILNSPPASKSFTLTCGGPGGTATDTVSFNITTPANPDFTFKCSPMLLVPLQRGGTAYVTLTVKDPVDGFSSQVSLSSNISPSSRGPSIDIGKDKLDPPFAPTPVSTTATISTASKTALGTYTITFTASGGGKTHTCTRTLEVYDDAETGAQPPSSVSVTSDPPCRKLTVKWMRPTTGPAPTAYKVYRTINTDKDGNPEWPAQSTTQISDTGDIQYSYPDIDPLSLTGINYYGITAIVNGIESPKAYASGVPRQCSSNLTGSDKDVIEINGTVNTTKPPIEPCSGSTNPDLIGKQFGLIRSGDIVTFKINICNSGSDEATIKEVNDIFTNLIKPKTGWDAQYNGQPLGDFGELVEVKNSQGVVTGLKFDFSKKKTVAIPTGSQTSYGTGSITFRAQVNEPKGSSSGLYRFQNVATIVEASGAGTTVKTPLFLFGTGAGSPNLEEVAP